MKPMIAAALIAVAAPAAAQVSPQRLSDDVKTLASDAFEGRAPGTAGEAKTIDWLAARMKALKLQPGGTNGGWTQDVPLVRTQLGEGSVRAGDVTLDRGRDLYVSTVRPVDRVAIANAPMVFVGYGVAAPERGWDDFKGVDLKGKVAVFLVNDPDFEAAAGDDAKGKFGDRRMTYYGRWTYKFEEAARRGAIAALIVHDTPGAGYGWSTVVAPGGENYDIVRPEPNDRVMLQGWIEGAAASRLFAANGLDLAKLRVDARSASFKSVALKTSLSADIAVTHSTAMSKNVLGRIAGAKRPDEVVMFGAHWDAYGVGKPDAQGRTIRPGANDDALGVAGLLEIARLMKAGKAPDRSAVFAFWSAEERGLIGSESYAQKPLYPAAKTVANLTLDILNTGGPARDVMLVGNGQSSLEDDLATAAAAQRRVVTPEALPERGLFYRADHFPLARKGIPTLLLMAISGAPDLVKGGRAGGEEWLKGYMACYHQTCDAWTPTLDFTGAAQDVELVRTIGTKLANSTAWPTWKPGSEFKVVREASRQDDRK